MLNPTGIDRRSIHFKFTRKTLFQACIVLSVHKEECSISFSARKAIICQTERCLERRNIASKVCVNVLLSMHGHDMPPPLYMCTDCYKSSTKEIQKFCHNLLCPVSEIDLRCQNKVKIDFISKHSLLNVFNSSFVYRKKRSLTLFVIQSNVVYRTEIIQ